MIAISGGTHSGKTTCIRELSDRGFPVVAEAGIAVIEELRHRFGVDGQKRWRAEHAEEFQLMISRRQVENERPFRSRATTMPVYCDRGLPDGLAYCRFLGITPPSELEALVQSYPYQGAVLLETLPIFDRREQTGRTSTWADSKQLFHLLVAAYQSVGCPVHVVGPIPVAQRVELILSLTHKW